MRAKPFSPADSLIPEPSEPHQQDAQARPAFRNGIPLVQRPTGTVITDELIDRIREIEGV